MRPCWCRLDRGARWHIVHVKHVLNHKSSLGNEIQARVCCGQPLREGKKPTKVELPHPAALKQRKVGRWSWENVQCQRTVHCLPQHAVDLDFHHASQAFGMRVKGSVRADVGWPEGTAWSTQCCLVLLQGQLCARDRRCIVDFEQQPTTAATPNPPSVKPANHHHQHHHHRNTTTTNNNNNNNNGPSTMI